MIESLSRSREKANVQNFEIEKTREIGKERDPETIGIEAEKGIGSENETSRSRETTRERVLGLGDVKKISYTPQLLLENPCFGIQASINRRPNSVRCIRLYLRMPVCFPLGSIIGSCL